MNSKDKNMMEIFNKEIFTNCSLNIRHALSKIQEEDINKITEIRIRANGPLICHSYDGDMFVSKEDGIAKMLHLAYISSAVDLQQTLELVSENSIYAYHEEIKNGFITIKGGHRVGVCGKTVLDGSSIKVMKDISSINIRIAREVKGCSKFILPLLINKDSLFHTLIISPPNCGKTTLLRDILRQISNGIESLNFKGVKVGLVDERSEIAACFKGIPQNDVGVRTDVLDNCPKSQGIMLLIRSMSPVVIATDELGTKDDMEAVDKALSAGVKLITTTHAENIEELRRKPVIGEMFERGLFERIVILNNKRGIGTIEDVVEGKSLSTVWRCQNVS